MLRRHELVAAAGVGTEVAVAVLRSGARDDERSRPSQWTLSRSKAVHEPALQASLLGGERRCCGASRLRGKAFAAVTMLSSRTGSSKQHPSAANQVFPDRKR